MRIFNSKDPHVSEYESKIKHYENIASGIDAQPEFLPVGPLAVFTGIFLFEKKNKDNSSPIILLLEHLKFALNQEIRDWIVLYGQSCNNKYQKQMDEVLKFIENIEKRLSREIKDLEDIRLIMMAVIELRENEIYFDMNITPIEESFSMLQIHNINIAREEIERSETLRYRWGKLQTHCVRFLFNRKCFLRTFYLFFVF